MTTTNERPAAPDPEELHDRQVRAVSAAVAKLSTNLAPAEFTPEAVFEGAVKGGAAAILSLTDATAEQVANLLNDLAEGFRELERPSFRVVQ